MPYTPAELASFTPALREDSDEALALLTKYADVSTSADTHDLRGRILQIAKTFELCGWTKERDAIVAAYNALNNYVEIRCRHARDAVSPYSIPNYFAPEHKTARAYAARVAQEKRDLEGFPVARTSILARVGLVLSGTVLDATLERMRTEPLTAPVVAGAVSLADAVAA